MKAKAVPIILTTTVLCCSLVHSFIHQPLNQNRRLPSSFSLFHKIFEESGPLGKGVTVGKVQVCLFTKDRSAQSIFKFLERKADSISSSASSATLARLANEVCLQLLRKQDDWTAACSESKWFSQNDAAKAESYFNELANREAAKFEKVRDSIMDSWGRLKVVVSLKLRIERHTLQEYIKGSQSDDDGDSTLAVVSLVVEIEGDTTK